MQNIRYDLVVKYVKLQLVLLYPITTHFFEIVYQEEFYSKFLEE